MSKYDVGQKLFWIKYTDDWPEMRMFEVGSIKITKKGVAYSAGDVGAHYVPEAKCFSNVNDALLNAVAGLEKLTMPFLDEIENANRETTEAS